MNSPASVNNTLAVSYDEALKRVPEALKSEGFGVLTEIDIQATLKAKLGADFRRYKILGACNPQFAHRALGTDLQVGLLLPCNVVVYENDQGTATVMAVDPTKTVAAMGDPRFEALAVEVKDKLVRALAKLA